jgi:tripartite-type tricarboxylate transporter receptor subunit TctC
MRQPVHLSRRQTLALAAGVTAGVAYGSATAASWPVRRVLVVVPFAGGGSADVYARLLAPHLEQHFGQPFIIDDRPGAAAIVGSEYVRTSAADGYTLLVISNTHTVNETLYPNKPYKLSADFTPVAPINSSDLVLVTRPTLGAKSVSEIIAIAKAAPGKLTFASSGAGTPYHMAGELFKQMAGIDVLHVPYKGSTPARMDVISGQIDMMFDATTTMIGLIESGQVTGIATTGPTKSQSLPNLPVVAETIPQYSATIWLGIVAPTGTPAEIVDNLNSTMSEIARRPDVAADWLRQGAAPMDMAPAAFAEFIRSDIAKWATVVNAAGLSVR